MGHCYRASEYSNHSFSICLFRRNESKESGYHSVSLDELITEPDFVSVRRPLNNTSPGQLGAAEINLKKQEANLLNPACWRPRQSNCSVLMDETSECPSPDTRNCIAVLVKDGND